MKQKAASKKRAHVAPKVQNFAYMKFTLNKESVLIALVISKNENRVLDSLENTLPVQIRMNRIKNLPKAREAGTHPCSQK